MFSSVTVQRCAAVLVTEVLVHFEAIIHELVSTQFWASLDRYSIVAVVGGRVRNQFNVVGCLINAL